MKAIGKKYLITWLVIITSLSLNGQEKMNLSYLGKEFKEIIYIERSQYVPDHHNTETMFQKGEINESSFAGNSSMKAFSLRTGKSRTIIESKDGIVRDPELSFDGKKIIFSIFVHLLPVLCERHPKIKMSLLFQ